MNPLLDRLQPYPFEKLRDLFASVTPPKRSPIRLSVGEPQHATPAVVTKAMVVHLDGLSVYPTTAGMDSLREAIATWLRWRFQLHALDAATQVLPVNGTREALFAFAQCVINASRKPRSGGPLVVCPNPFYQIYEGAALLAGAEVALLNQTPANGFGLDLDTLSAAEWRRTQLIYMCSPGNPSGRVMTLDEWQALFDRADRCNAIIASDECYSEIYFKESAPPIGGLEAADKLGRRQYRNLVVFGSLSKRSNAPGMRSGYIAGDADLLKRFLLYRTYHGSAMGLAVQHASIAAWGDEDHVRDNRVQYRRKFDAVVPMLDKVLDVRMPDAGFYLWAGVPGGDDEAFARELLAHTNVAVLPGSYLGREAHGMNPGRGRVRIALVPEFDACVEAATRMVAFCQRA